MDYRELEKICKKRIVIWGYGAYGKAYAYLALKCVGSCLVAFCDREFKENESYKNIPLISKEDFFENYLDVFTFISMKSIEQQEKVKHELKEHGIESAIFDQRSFSELCTSIIESEDEEVLERYNEIINDEKYLSYMYEFKTGEKLDLIAPKTFNSKLQWLKMHGKYDIYTKLVDKSEVKSIVAEVIGEEYIIPTIGIWDSFEKIDFETLPDRFILKCTHDSGSALICHDKKTFDYESAKLMFKRALHTNLYWITREMPYKNVRPRIIAEPLLENSDGGELKDYKVFSFNGEPQIIQVDYDRFTNHTRAMYSTNWDYLGFSTEYTLHKQEEPKPEKLEKILELTRKLSKDMDHTRVDFYIVGNNIYFGELTFFHGSGYEKFSDEYLNERMGAMITAC